MRTKTMKLGSKTIQMSAVNHEANEKPVIPEGFELYDDDRYETALATMNSEFDQALIRQSGSE